MKTNRFCSRFSSVSHENGCSREVEKEPGWRQPWRRLKQLVSQGAGTRWQCGDWLKPWCLAALTLPRPLHKSRAGRVPAPCREARPAWLPGAISHLGPFLPSAKAASQEQLSGLCDCLVSRNGARREMKVQAGNFLVTISETQSFMSQPCPHLNLVVSVSFFHH